MRIKKIYSVALALVVFILTSCTAAHMDMEDSWKTDGKEISAGVSVGRTSSPGIPKYIFLFIGDGMSYPQIQLAADYLHGKESICFLDFPAAGSATTHNSNRLIPDSASAGTSIATGHKTVTGCLGMDETAETSYQTIAEKVHSELGMKVGIISTASLNHATPAAFYAHQNSRNNYYPIGLDLMQSGFEFFAGGALISPKGDKGKQKSLYHLVKENGYHVVRTQKDVQKIDTLPVIAVDEHQTDSSNMEYEIDRGRNMWSLADYLKKGIDILDNEKGFFIMCEGGKIDMACHANDAATAIYDTLALSDAVSEAVRFAKQHKDETLIIVTGDHETGGLTIGSAGTKYDTYLSVLAKQKISFDRYNSDYVSAYKKKKTTYKRVLSDIERLFGLKTSGKKSDCMVMTGYEKKQLARAYYMSIRKKSPDMSSQEKYKTYGGYEPLTVTVTRILDSKAGVSFTTYSHTGLPAAVFAYGVGAEAFNGYYDNTEIYKKIVSALHIG